MTDHANANANANGTGTGTGTTQPDPGGSRITSALRPTHTRRRQVDRDDTSPEHPLDGPVLAVETAPPLPNTRRPGGRATDTFRTLQSWEGVVTEVLDSYFTARLVERSSTDEEEAEIPLAEVSPQDRHLLELGSRFYWTIGYRQTPAGQRSRQSLLIFQRRPVRRRHQYDHRQAWIDEVGDGWLT